MSDTVPSRTASRYTSHDIGSLITSQSSQSSMTGIADILLTHDWPKGITRLSRNKLAILADVGCEPIADLALSIRPRYHLSSAEKVFFEREPYRNVGKEGNLLHTTRFIGL